MEPPASADPFPELSEETICAPIAPPAEAPLEEPSEETVCLPPEEEASADSPAIQLPTIAVQAEDLLLRDTSRLPVISEDMPTQCLSAEEAHDAQTVYLPSNPSPTQKPKEPKEKKPSKKGRVAMIIGIVVGSLIALCVLGLLIFGLVLKNGDFIYPNVYVTDKLNVGGMDRQTAIAAVKKEMEASYASSTLTVQLPDRTLDFTPDKTNVAVNAEAAIDEAMSYGRNCNPFRAVFNYISSNTNETKDYRVSKLELNTEYIRTTLEDVAAEVRTEPSDSSVSFDEQTQQLEITVGQAERSLNVDGLYEVIYTAFEQGNFETITWAYDEVPAKMPELEQIFDTYCTPVQDAYYDEETHTLIEAVPGYGFDMEELQQRMADAEPGSKHIIEMTDLEPKKDLEALEKELFGTELFSYSTAYVNNANRTKNLTLACQAINGLILNPGDEFSFNNVVGERTAAKGYMQATVYNGGLSVPELGGGVCQVASTLYYCTLHLDLEQVQREPHMFVVDYVPKGMDATIYWGKIDYRFKNTLDQPIRILINTDNGHVNATFQGAKPLDFSVKMDFEIKSTIWYEEKEEVDETKEPGYSHVEITPYVGYRVETYKTIYDADGNELSKKLEATSSYSKRDKLTIVGPPEAPEDPFDPGLWDDPENPDPENPDPENPDPENPDPENPDPENPDPETPDPENPDPVVPDPFEPENPDTQVPDDGSSDGTTEEDLLGPNDLPIV